MCGAFHNRFLPLRFDYITIRPLIQGTPVTKGSPSNIKTIGIDIARGFFCYGVPYIIEENLPPQNERSTYSESRGIRIKED